MNWIRIWISYILIS